MKNMLLRQWHCRVLLVLCLFLPVKLFAVEAAAGDGMRVLASIKPLQLIAQAITDGVSQAQVLLPEGYTPHDYALKPSDLVRVYDADLVLWLGAEFESYLAKPMAMRDGVDLAVNILNEPFDERADDNDHASHNDHHSHLYGDPHVWFSPEQALLIAEAVVQRLAQKDPDNTQRYSGNLMVFREQLQLADERIKAQLRTSGAASYLVYHDAYSHFEDYYGLTHVAVVTGQPEQKLGAKGLLNLRKIIFNQQVKCLFTEPQADADIVDILQEDSAMKVYQLDPMAGKTEVSVTGYMEFLERTAASFMACR